MYWELCHMIALRLHCFKKTQYYALLEKSVSLKKNGDKNPVSLLFDNFSVKELDECWCG